VAASGCGGSGCGAGAGARSVAVATGGAPGSMKMVMAASSIAPPCGPTKAKSAAATSPCSASAPVIAPAMIQAGVRTGPIGRSD
jgi:hypothetical protein